MTPFLKNMLVIARRDFLAIVATPTFLLFLLAPLFMVGMGLAGGMGASQLADSARGAGRIVAVVGADDVEALRAADARLRASGARRGPVLEVRIASPATADPVAIAREKGSDTYAVLSGPLTTPRIADGHAGHMLAANRIQFARRYPSSHRSAAQARCPWRYQWPIHQHHAG